jgi:hypothetical protein
MEIWFLRRTTWFVKLIRLITFTNIVINIVVSSICAAPVSNMCSTQVDNNSRKLRLRCGCQFPWCALALREQDPPHPRTYFQLIVLTFHSMLCYLCNVYIVVTPQEMI